MIRILTFTFLLGSLPSGATAQDASPFRPDSVVQAPGGPTIVMVTVNPGGTAALRLSVPLTENAAEAGAGLVLARLALNRMGGPARQIGARVHAERTPWGIAYRVEGAEADIEYLTYLLRLAAQEPASEPHVRAAIRDELASDLKARAEAPLERILSDLVTDAAPAEISTGGTLETLAELRAARLQEVWSRSHRSARMSVVAVTGLDSEVLLAGLDRLGATSDTARSLGSPPAPQASEIPVPAALRTWHGLAWTDGSKLDPHAEVLATLMTGHLEAGASETEMTVRRRQLSDRSMLVLAGGAYARNSAGMRTRLLDLLPAVRASIDGPSVTAARMQVALALARAAGDSGGLAEHIGWGFEATGNPFAAVAHYDALSAVTARSLTEYIDTLTGPLTASVTR